MNKLEQLISQLNAKQKLIFAIAVPLALFIVAVTIADAFDHDYFNSEPFNFKYTWWVWLVYICIVGFLEYKIFDDKSNITQ